MKEKRKDNPTHVDLKDATHYQGVGEHEVDDINDEVAKSKVLGGGCYTPRLRKAEAVDNEEDEGGDTDELETV